MQEKGGGRTGLDFIKSDGCMRECVKTQNSEEFPFTLTALTSHKYQNNRYH